MSVYDELEFAPVLITDVFESLNASLAWYDKNKIERGAGAYPYVSRSGVSNGHESVVGHQTLPPNSGNCITIGVSTSTVFYQPSSFYTSKEIQVLRHSRLTACSGLALVTLLRQQMGKFQWGNGASLDRLKATRIMVPVTTDAHGDQVVDWGGMTRLGEELFSEVITHTHSARQTDAGDNDSLPDLRFEPMLITDVFEKYRQAPAWLNTNQVRVGEPEYPHVTNSAASNSVSGFIAHQGFDPNPGNAITVGIDTQVVAYQPAPFYGATKVYELRSPELTEDSAPILVSALKKGVEKFSWGHKASAGRLSKTRIMVPVTTDAHGDQVVDWGGMTTYGRALRVRAERQAFSETVVT